MGVRIFNRLPPKVQECIPNKKEMRRDMHKFQIENEFDSIKEFLFPN